MADKKLQTVTVLGSTGSVGKQVLAVLDKYPDRFKVVGLSAFTNEKLLRDTTIILRAALKYKQAFSTSSTTKNSPQNAWEAWKNWRNSRPI